MVVMAQDVLLALADWSRVNDEICLLRSRHALVSTDGTSAASDSTCLAANSLAIPDIQAPGLISQVSAMTHTHTPI